MSTVQLLCTVFLVHVCSVLASETEFFSIPADEKATACGLDDFQIDTLTKANYWSVPFAWEHLDKCFIPDGYERHQVSSCQLHFSVCRSIPEGICEGHPNSTACQEVVTEDGLRHYYGIGESQESYEFKPNGYPSSDGFFTVRHGNTVSHHRSRSCRGPFKISLKFVCDRDRVWDPLSHDASTHVRVIVIFDHCHLEIEFGYSGACQRVAPTLAPAMSTCLLPPYNLTGLTRYDYWFAEVDNSFCYSNSVDLVKSCTFYFAFCGALPVEKTKEISQGCLGASVCQTGLVEHGLGYKEFTYSMGQFETFTRFFFNGKRPGGGFHMDIVNGSIPGCRSGNRTRVSLACNSSTVWTNQNLTKIIHVEKIGPCEYELILPYNGACSTILPGSTVLPPAIPQSAVTPASTPAPYSAPTLTPAVNDNCQLPPYNTTGLTRHEYWFAQAPSLCYGHGYPSLRDCTVYFAFCRPLPTILGSKCAGEAICQTFIVDNDQPPPFVRAISYSMGQFKNYTRFSYNEEFAGGGFHVKVGNGSRIPECRNSSINTTVVLTCNSSAVWSSQNLTNIFHAEKTGRCEYRFVLPYSGACLPVFPNATVLPSTAHPTMTTSSKINTTNVHPHPTTTFKPPPSSSHHHTINSTTKHPSSTPTRNSTTMTPTSTRSMPTSSPHHTPNSTTKHPSSTPTKNSTTMTHTSSRHVATSTASFSPTAAPHVVTTNTTPVDPDKRIVLGLIIGVVLFAVLSIVLLVMVIIAVRVLIKKNHKLKFLKMES